MDGPENILQSEISQSQRINTARFHLEEVEVSNSQTYRSRKCNGQGLDLVACLDFIVRKESINEI